MLKKIFINIVLLFFLLSTSSFAQSIMVHATTDSIEYKIGDYINYRLEISYDKNVTFSLPSIKDSVNNLVFIKELPVVKIENENKINEIYTFVFSKYDSVELTIPSYKLIYNIAGKASNEFVTVNPVDLVVVTLDIDDEADIMDVKDPMKIGLDWMFILIVVLIILLILSGSYFGYRYYKKKKAGEPILKKIVKIPPYKVALKALYELEEKKLWQQGEIKEYHSDITGIVRKYFEDRFGVLALEMHSSELLDELNKVKEASQVFDYTKEFLSNADMVKFAKFEPMPSVNEEMMKQAKEIVHKTKEEKSSEVIEGVANVE